MVYSSLPTKDKSISYKQKLFIKTSLRQLGINPKNNGFLIFQKIIIYVYKKDMTVINLEEIYKEISKNTSITANSIGSTLRYSFYNINTKKLISNYEKIFGIEFDSDYFSIRNLISDFKDILENMEEN